MNPLVSCLCISENRTAFLKKTITYFVNQTYPNKELIVVSRKHNPAYESLINKHNKERTITYLWPDTLVDLTLGDLRNMAIEKSTGEYWCVWDDDDWYHNRRIEIQLGEMLSNKKEGVILSYAITFDRKNKLAYLSSMVLPPSIMCKRSLKERGLHYPSMNSFEDLTFLQKAYAQNILFPLVRPMLYIYICHGTNTMSRKHFEEKVFKQSQQLSPDTGKRIFDIVSGRMPYNEASQMLESSEILEELNYFSPIFWGSRK